MMNQQNQKPKVAIIGLKGLPAFGGSARAGENMMRFLKDQYDFTVFNTSTHTKRKTGVYDGIKQVVFKQFFIKSMNTFWYYLCSLFYCLVKKYDVVHVFHVDAAFIIPILRIRNRVIAGHRARPQLADKWNPLVKKYFTFMEWLFFHWPADVLTSVSRPVVEEFQPHTKRKICYVPNGIIMPDMDALPHIDESSYVLFASGRIIKLKGCHVLLEALKKMKYRGRVIIIGNRTHNLAYTGEIEKLAEGLNVKFMDLITDKNLLMAYLKNAKVFVFPSFHEGMSNMLLEAGSMKVPIICSDIPENQQVFDSDEVIFFEKGNSLDLANKLEWVFNNPEEAARYADRAFDRLVRDYNWENLSLVYHELYQWLINKKRPLNNDETLPEAFLK